MSRFEWASLVVAAITAVVTLGGVVFVGLQVRIAVASMRDATASRREDWHQRRCESSLRFYMTTLDKRDMYKNVLPADRDTQAIATLISEAEHDDIKLATIRTYLNYFEMLATGVNYGVLDEETVAALAGSRIIAVWNNYRPWIMSQRETFQVSTLSLELQRLAERLRLQQTNDRDISVGG